MNAIYIQGRRNGYSADQCGRTMTVGELIGFLEQFDEDTLIYLKNDSGYTFGNITESSFEEALEEDDAE